MLSYVREDSDLGTAGGNKWPTGVQDPRDLLLSSGSLMLRVINKLEGIDISLHRRRGTQVTSRGTEEQNHVVLSYFTVLYRFDSRFYPAFPTGDSSFRPYLYLRHRYWLDRVVSAPSGLWMNIYWSAGRSTPAVPVI